MFQINHEEFITKINNRKHLHFCLLYLFRFYENTKIQNTFINIKLQT